MVIALVRGTGHHFPDGIKLLQVKTIDNTTNYRDWLQGIDVIVHTAARVHRMKESRKDPLKAYRAVNTEATLNLARQAAEAGVKRFIFISSIKVNGESTSKGHPFTYADIPKPIDPYAISKYEAEKGLCELATKTNLETVILRPPLVYGPGVKANFRKLLQIVHRGIPLPLGSVNNQRSFVYIENFVDLIHACIENPAAANQLFLVSDDHDVSTQELFRKLAGLMHRRANLIPVPTNFLIRASALLGKQAQMSRLIGNLQIDIHHTKETLGWKPMFSFDEGLKKTVQQFLKQ